MLHHSDLQTGPPGNSLLRLTQLVQPPSLSVKKLATREEERDITRNGSLGHWIYLHTVDAILNLLSDTAQGSVHQSGIK